jgi:hypothetical protein
VVVVAVAVAVAAIVCCLHHLGIRSLLKNASSGMLRRVALVRTDVSEELSASIIRVTGTGELVITLALITFYFFAACISC